MATLALGLASTLVGGPVGVALGAVGAIAGSYIDQRHLLPTLFPGPNIVGERIQELHIQGADEGFEVPTVFGTQARVTGGVIWHSGWIEEKVEEDVGGKGGDDGQKRITYNNYMSLAVALSRRQCSALQKIIIEGKVLYNANPNVSLAASGCTITVPTTPLNRMIINSPAGGANLGLLVAGKDATIAGATNGANNGTFRVKSSKTNPDGSSSVSLKVVGAIAESGSTLTVNQTLPSFDTAKVASITFYPGSSSQAADPIIQAYETAAQTPAFRGICYVVLERLRLNEYGNRVPQMSFIVTGNGSETIQTVVSGLMTDAGCSGSDYDVTGLATTTVLGYPIGGLPTTLQSFHPLILAYDILGQESAGKIRFFHRKDAQIIPMLLEEMSVAVDTSEPTARKLEWDKPSDKDLPKEVTLKYNDPSSDDQVGSQRERRRVALVNGVVEVDVTPLTITATEARAATRRMLWSAINDRRVCRFNILPKYAYIQENDIIRTVEDGVIYDLLVRRLDRGQNDVIEVEASLEIQEVLTQTGEAEAADNSLQPNAIAPGGDVLNIFAEPSLLRDNFSGTPSLVFGAEIEDEDGLWRSAAIYESYDGTNYHLLRQVNKEATIGYANTALGTTSLPECWDLVNTVDVQLVRGSLASSTDADVLAGTNRILIGNEVIGFVNATLVGTRTYRLSRLIRGLRNSEAYVGTHAIGDGCLLLTAAGVEYIDFNAAAIGATRYYKIVGGGQALADVTAQTVTFTGRSLKPFSPVCLSSVRDTGTNDVTLSWDRRTRMVTDCFAAILPLGEAYEKYEVEILNGSTVVRTITVSSAESTIYTSAQQTTDGIGTGAFNFRVYQISAAVGRGIVSNTYAVPGA